MSAPTLTEQVALLSRLTSKSMSDMQHEVLEGIVATLPRYEAAMDLAEVAGRLIDRIDEVYESKEYKAVWALAQLHNGPYSGPHFADEMDFARTALAAYRREVSNG